MDRLEGWSEQRRMPDGPNGSDHGNGENEAIEFLDIETGEVLRSSDRKDEGRLKFFSMDEVGQRLPEWEQKGGQIAEEFNWEDDDDVMAIHTRVRRRMEKYRGEDYPDILWDQAMSEELDKFVTDHPEKAREYARRWKEWADIAGVQANIDEKEWRLLVRTYPGAAFMGQYRVIARALARAQQK